MTETNTTSTTGEEPIARTASTIASEAGRTAEQQASRTMDRAAETLETVGDAVRQASDSLREQQPQLASIADAAVDQVDRTTAYLREHQPREIVSSVESWARRQPALAIGGALVLGIVAGRFLRSASPPASESTDSRSVDGYRSAGAYSGGRTPLLGSYEATNTDRQGYGSVADRSTLDDVASAQTDEIEANPDGVLDDGIDELAAGTTRVTADSGVR